MVGNGNVDADGGSVRVAEWSIGDNSVSDVTSPTVWMDSDLKAH